MEDPSCNNKNESGNDLCYQHTRTVATFENPFISKSNLDSEDSTCGIVLILDCLYTSDEHILILSRFHLKKTIIYNCNPCFE
jgi:hypothetical protein